MVKWFIGFIQEKTILSIMTRSASVGMIGTSIDIGVFTWLHLFLGIPVILASTISYGAGSINSFSMHRSWTFANRPKRSGWVQFIQFHLVGLGALFINYLVFFTAPYIYTFHIDVINNDLAAKLCATGLGICWSFILNNLWTFRKIC